MSGRYSAFLTPDDVHEREIELNGQKVTVYFREAPHSAYFRYLRELTTSENTDERDAATSRYVARCLCEPDGSPSLTGEEACKLRTSVVNQMMEHIKAINKATDAGKGSPPEA